MKSNFDGAIAKFARSIYQTPKGKVRLAVLQRDLLRLRNGKPLRILDVGAGMGQMGLWFAEAGHQVVLCDISADMLEEARQRAVQLGVADQVELIQSDLFELADIGTFDIVLCHAVLEWVERQQQFVERLTKYVGAHGWLSLMPYNATSKLMHNLVLGNFEYVASGMKRRSRQRLSPQWPVVLSELELWLNELQLDLNVCSGVRVFSDYVRDRDHAVANEEQLIELELQQSRNPNLIPIARYVHYLCQRAG
ncbi:methyltransferase domain-containing protein [Neiella marina]|uniref:tRNA 5-carboxymethoxyuridine methyltransferase n=1 Tax=Neiella holothuriorum TaxID=2870530 RepID=A0ABS7ECV3_9GAMM|nr:methyltransferase [Neiella holothuriorum]MBW8190164.1 methyltransferase domain-containing protein [Neiella holothuriorum]